MVLYTIVPPEEIFDEPEIPEMVEIVRGEMRLLITPTGQARGRIVRLISSNPADYLLPAYQPGMEIGLLGNDLRDVPFKEDEAQ